MNENTYLTLDWAGESSVLWFL